MEQERTLSKLREWNLATTRIVTYATHAAGTQGIQKIYIYIYVYTKVYGLMGPDSLFLGVQVAF